MVRVMRRLAVLLFLLSPALAGCGSTAATPVLSAPSQASAVQAQSNVQAAVAPIEAWFAERGTYAGATAAELRASYDSTLPDVRVAWASASAYCLDSTVGGTAMSLVHPGGMLTPGLCAPQ
jgi:ABC-type glycerol-3-phosphate transport system substrate-binding protein